MFFLLKKTLFLYVTLGTGLGLLLGERGLLVYIPMVISRVGNGTASDFYVKKFYYEVVDFNTKMASSSQ